MESFAQELIDAIIDYLPRSGMHSCSLVSSRWRRRCQQRTFARVMFWEERDVALWCMNIPQDPGGIPGYVQKVKFFGIDWLKPTLFGRVLECFSKLKSLVMVDTSIPLACGTTAISSILSLPNLQELSLHDVYIGLCGVEVRGGVSAPPNGSQRRTLRLLKLHNVTTNVITTLARYPFTFRRIRMGVPVESLSMAQLLEPSSQTLVCLELQGVYSVVDFPIDEVVLIDSQ